MKEFNLKSMAVGMLFLLMVQVSVCWAAYTIDADLSDWGVTPFTDWIPDGNADYEQTDNINRYGAGGYSEPYDWEALYFDDDGENFYFAGVSSYQVGQHSSSDLGIDLNGDFTIGGSGNVTGLEYAVQMDDNFGELSVNPNWSNRSQGSPQNATGGTVLGSATVVIKQYPSMESGTYIFEASVPRYLFKVRHVPGEPVSAHMATWCGNDSINLTGDINTPPIPEIDIRCDRSDAVLRILADDFECIVPGGITEVVLWGSWKDDIKGQIQKIHLSIHNNIPADACDPCSCSKPGNELWSRDFGTGEFSETLYADQNNPDWFWDPAGGQTPDPCNDYKIWQYEIPIGISDAFLHGGDPCNPVIYWLDVYVELEPDSNNPQFGWKTSLPQWEDDAVWSNDDGTTWNELRYPSQHSRHPNSIDMAFAITSTKLPVPHLKWSQPPIEIYPNAATPTYCGWDEPSWRRYKFSEPIWFDAWDCLYQCHGDADCLKQGNPMTGYWRVGTYDLNILMISWNTSYPGAGYDPRADFNRDLQVDYEDVDILTSWWQIKEPPKGPGVPADCPGEPVGGSNEFWKVVADDFRCLGSMPVTSIHWWGSYYGCEGQEAPTFAPISWRIGFWSNVAKDPCDPNTFSRPEELLWQIEVDVNRVDETVVGRDSFPQRPYDTCFQYYVDLEPNEVFQQGDFNDSTEDNIYWLSIAAVYPEGVANVQYPWGWKTRPWHWMDDAVTFEVHESPQIGMTLDPCNSYMKPIKDSTFGVMESYDMAFELDTDPNYIKWEQAYNGIRYWEHYEDEKSMVITNDTNGWFLENTFQVPEIYRLDGLAFDDSTGHLFGVNASGIPDTLYEFTTGGSLIASHGLDFLPGVGGSRSLDYNRNTGNLLLTEISSSEIYEITTDGVLIGSITGPVTGAHGMAYNSSTDTIFIADAYPSSIIYEVDPGNGNVLNSFNAPGNFAGGLAFYGTSLLVYETIDQRIYLLDPTNGTVRDSFDVAIPQGDTGLTCDGTRIYAWDNSNERVNVYASSGAGSTQRLVADDWRCERRTPVTAIVWWGSYIDYAYEACQSQVMSPPVKPDYFKLSIWTDVPKDACEPGSFSHPKDVIWQYKAYDYDEVLVGYDKHPNGEPNEPVFRYSVRLPEEKWFKQPDVNGIFWLSVVAVYDTNVPNPNYDWGWTNHQHTFNDDAVAGIPIGSGDWSWQELYDQLGDSEDMSFVLFTDPNECVICADYNLDSIINFVDYADFADNWLWTGSAGGYNNSDLNCDGHVDFYDLGIFVEQWLDSCP